MTSIHGLCYRWQEGFQIAEGPVDHSADAVESWRVHQGQMRGRKEHLQRWMQSCKQLLSTDDLILANQVFKAALAMIPEQGDWFPRLDMHRAPQPQFTLQLRPCPTLKTAIRLDPRQWPDPRQHPERKGPDLDRLRLLRQQCQQAGYDEGFLMPDSTVISEGIYCSFIWWRKGNCYRTDPSIATLPGVTLKLLEHIGTHLGKAPLPGILRPDRLYEGPLWACNALHGLMEVISIGDQPLARNSTDLILWRQALHATKQPLTEP